jgi:peroxiredoxin Q/BCP
MIEVGRKAPAFTLKDQDGRPVSSGNLKGQWVILYFYPRDDTPGCTQEACEFTVELERFQALEAVVIGVSPDAPASHRRFVEKHGLRVTLLSDPGHAVMEKFGAWGKKTMYGKAFEGVIRSTAIIDPAGNVAHHWPRVKARGHAGAVLEKLEELRQAPARQRGAR